MTTPRDDTPTRLESAAAALLRSQAAEIERLRAEANTCGSGAGCCAQAAEIERMKADAELFAKHVGVDLARKDALLRECLTVISASYAEHYMNLPAPSAWRYTHHIPDGTISYQYDTARPKNCNHPNYTPMFTQDQLNQYGRACFEEGRDARAMVEPMTDVADRYAHRMAMVLECVLMDRASDRWWNEGAQLIGEYRSAMNAIHEQHSPTHMGEPLLHNA